jgi:DNA-binding MurR/RpiR family transcriptional regulator
MVMADAEARNGPPPSYEALIRVIHEDFERFSPTYRQIAEFLTRNPNEIGVYSVNALAERCGVHASSLVRFAQLLGYRGFKDLQGVFQLRLMTAAPGFEARAERLKAELGAKGGAGPRGLLREMVVRDIAALEGLLTDAGEAALAEAIETLARARTVYLIGQLRSEPVVGLMRYVLTMLRRRAVLLDPSGGLATHMARLIGPEDALVAVSFRFYATEVVNVAEAAAAAGVPIVAISDSTLSPLAKSAAVLFAVPEQEYTFARSLAAPMCLAQALLLGLAARLNADGEGPPRIPVATER